MVAICIYAVGLNHRVARIETLDSPCRLILLESPRAQ